IRRSTNINACYTLKLNLLTDAKAEATKDAVADQKTAAKAALIYTCPVCRVSSVDPKTFKQHFKSKHPKSPMVPVLVDVQALSDHTLKWNYSWGNILPSFTHSRQCEPPCCQQNSVLNA
uniref:Uncharacterized protein n=1 Tax=Hucho hucho TaxID=62062 RepID=A0A4W5LJC9_9TELE